MENSKKLLPSHLFILFLIFIIGFVARYYNLTDRPIHHDESLHGVYSLYVLKNPNHQYYKYNPLLHGPFLYNVFPWFFHFLDASRFALRLPGVLIGSFFVLFPLLFRRILSPVSILVSSTFIALSPILVTYSRFMRHDSFVFLSLALSIYGLIQPKSFFKAPIFMLGLAIQFATKENIFIHLAFLVAYLIYEFFLQTISKNSENSLIKRFKTFCNKNKLSVFLSIGLFLYLYLYYYTAGFRYWAGPLDGLYRKSLAYWVNQHNIQRISGPFSFNFLINSLYEAWWLPALFIHLYSFYINRAIKWFLILLSSLLISGLCHYQMLNDTSFFLINFFKFKIPMDCYLAFPLIFHSVIVTTIYHFEEKKLLSFASYLFFASLFTYSFVGEKVPWLAAYPALFGLIFFTLEFDRNFHWPIIIVSLALLYPQIHHLKISILELEGRPENLLSQVHTTREFDNVMKGIRSEMALFPRGEGPMLYAKDLSWPTSWYFRDRPEYHYFRTSKKIEDYKYVLTVQNLNFNLDDRNLNDELVKHFEKRAIPLRSWWVPDYSKMSLKNLWNYYWYKTPWNPTGAEYIDLWIKKKQHY